MSAYQPPIDDMLFALRHAADMDGIRTLPGHEDLSWDMAEAVVAEAGRLAAEVIAPLNWIGDRQGARRVGDAVKTPDGWKAAFDQVADGGWIGLACGTAQGGQGLPAALGAAASEMWHAASASFALCNMLTQGAIEAITLAGSAEQKALFIPPMLDGRWTGTMNLTEPQAGSDLSAIRTRAVPDGDRHRIAGQKIYITYGDHDLTDNIVHLVLARLADAPAGVKGVSLFIVPKIAVNADGTLGAPNDVRCVSLENKLGIHASPTAVMSYGDGGGAIGHLVGEPNRGLEYMFIMMNRARFEVGLQGLGLAERAYQAARAYALDRVQGKAVGASAPGPIVDHPDVRRMLMDMKSRREAMRALCYRGAALMDRAARDQDEAARARAQAQVDFLTPIVKGWCTETSQDLASTAIQIHGGIGYVEETGVAQHYRDARITTIYEGTTGIQANDLMFRKLLRDGGGVADDVVAAARATAAMLTAPALAVMRAALSAGVDALETTTRALLDRTDAPARCAAGAHDYLRLAGTVLAGEQLARCAAAAARDLKAGDGRAAFAESKIATAHFYARHTLAEAQTYAQKATAGADAVFGLSNDRF